MQLYVSPRSARVVGSSPYLFCFRFSYKFFYTCKQVQYNAKDCAFTAVVVFAIQACMLYVFTANSTQAYYSAGAIVHDAVYMYMYIHTI